MPDPSEVLPYVTWPGDGDTVPPDAWIDITVEGPSDPGYGERLRARATIDGAPIEGEIQPVDNADWRFLWRPARPWPDGAEVTFGVWLDADEDRARTRRFTVDGALAVAVPPLAESTITTCIADVVTERGPCDDINGCGCTGEPQATEERVQVRVEITGQFDASRRGYGIVYGFGTTAEEAEAGQGVLFPGREMISRTLPGDLAGERCVALRRLDADGVEVDRHTACAAAVVRCDGEPLDDADDAGAGCSQSLPDDPPGLPWLLLGLGAVVIVRRART